jgi:hypothetical protein
VYVAFDILYQNGQSCLHLPLEQRKDLLRDAVRQAPKEGHRIGHPDSVVSDTLKSSPDPDAQYHPWEPSLVLRITCFQSIACRIMLVFICLLA